MAIKVIKIETWNMQDGTISFRVTARNIEGTLIFGLSNSVKVADRGNELARVIQTMEETQTHVRTTDPIPF
jgi:hypothetical protein